MPVHRIQLRGPWDYAGDGAGPAGRVQLPADCAAFLGDFCGPVQLVRKFNRPGRLPPGELVLVVVEQVVAAAEVSLDGAPLGTIPAGGAAAFDITSRMHAAAYQLTIRLAASDAPRTGRPWNVAALDIVSE